MSVLCFTVLEVTVLFRIPTGPTQLQRKSGWWIVLGPFVTITSGFVGTNGRLRIICRSLMSWEIWVFVGSEECWYFQPCWKRNGLVTGIGSLSESRLDIDEHNHQSNEVQPFHIIFWSSCSVGSGSFPQVFFLLDEDSWGEESTENEHHRETKTTDGTYVMVPFPIKFSFLTTAFSFLWSAEFAPAALRPS